MKNSYFGIRIITKLETQNTNHELGIRNLELGSRNQELFIVTDLHRYYSFLL
jgi:hypothetical protein